MYPNPSAFMRLLHHGVRLLALPALLAAPLAHADDYSDVNQLLRLGKHAEALTRADQYLAGKPRDPQMRFLKGVIQSESGKQNDAVATFAKLTDEFPELPEPYNNLAVIYASQGQYDKARIALEMAIRTNPSYATAQENLGDIYARMASQAYNKALQIDAGSAAAQPKLAMIRDLGAATPSGTTAKTGASASTHTAALTKPAAATAAATAVTAAANAISAAPVAKPATTATTTTPAPAATTPAHASAATHTPAAPNAGPSAAQKSVEAAVRAWASAWESKDMGAYLGAYDKSFSPPNKASRKVWEKERHTRIVGKNNIDVKIRNLAVTVKDKQATARFHQDYSAGKFNASSRKTLELVKSGDRWLIVSEATGG
jgi:tetratricopeptide (TPR) repeat protein